MLKIPDPIRSCIGIAAVMAIMAALSACTPAYDWRDVHGTAAVPFSVLMPAKPTIRSRSINLDGVQFVMTLTVAEVKGVTYAVSSAQLPESAKPLAALHALETALLSNIGGTIKDEKSSAAADAIATIDIQAAGAPTAASGGQPTLLYARFTAQGQHIYQVVVLGRDKAISRNAVDTFFTSFKLN